MAKRDSTKKKGEKDADITLPAAGRPEKLERQKEKLVMEISNDAVKKYKSLPRTKRLTLIKRYIIRKWPEEDLAALFSRDVRTIQRDLKEIRDKVWKDVATDKGAQKLLKEIYAELCLVDDEVVRELWQLFTRTKNDNVKLGCLKQIGERQAEVIKVMQSLGLIAKAPEKLELDMGVKTNAHINKVLDELAKK